MGTFFETQCILVETTCNKYSRCLSVQITQGKVAYMSEMGDGRQRHLVADNDITAGSWHNVTLAVSGPKRVCQSLDKSLMSTKVVMCEPLNMGERAQNI